MESDLGEAETAEITAKRKRVEAQESRHAVKAAAAAKCTAAAAAAAVDGGKGREDWDGSTIEQNAHQPKKKQRKKSGSTKGFEPSSGNFVAPGRRGRLAGRRAGEEGAESL